MADALSKIGTRNRITPQTVQADPREVVNNAGGYVFEVGDIPFLHRFLTIGTEGGTYYVKENTLTKDAAKNVIDLAKANDPRLIDMTVDISQAGRAPRNNPALFALAV